MIHQASPLPCGPWSTRGTTWRACPNSHRIQFVHCTAQSGANAPPHAGPDAIKSMPAPCTGPSLLRVVRRCQTDELPPSRLTHTLQQIHAHAPAQQRLDRGWVGGRHGVGRCAQQLLRCDATLNPEPRTVWGLECLAAVNPQLCVTSQMECMQVQGRGGQLIGRSRLLRTKCKHGHMK
jgi:hypothetical protein